MPMQGAITETITLRDVMVPMRCGTRLATDVTLPARGGKPLDGPFPTLLHRTPYDKSAARLSEISVADRIPKSNVQVAEGLALGGYAVLTQDCRGRYASEGVFAKYLGEGEDGFDTLAWATEQPWCRGDFGTFGLSYSAHVQTALAVLNPPGLRTMFLDSGGFWNAYQGGVRRGGAFEMKQVTWAFKHACLSPAGRDPATAKALAAEDISAWIAGLDWRRGTSPLRHVPEYEAYLFDQWERGNFDDFWQKPELYAAPHYARLARYPTFLISGWYDPYAETMFQHFMGLRAHGGHAELVMGPWLHGRRSQTFAGDQDFGTGSTFDDMSGATYDQMRHAWFDQWLMPQQPTPSQPRTTWFAMGANVWRNDTTWPPSNVVETAYYLTDMGLSRTPPPSGSVLLRADPARPVPTLGGALTSGEPVMNGGVFDQVTTADTFGVAAPFGPLRLRDDVLCFATEPLETDVEIAGPVSVCLTLVCDTPDADIAVKLLDWAPPSKEHPDGFAANISDSILRLRYRDSWEAPTPVPLGIPVTVTVDAPPTANIFKRGHRIRLDISGSNFPKYDVNPNTGEDVTTATATRVARTELRLGAARLLLSVLSG